MTHSTRKSDDLKGHKPNGPGRFKAPLKPVKPYSNRTHAFLMEQQSEPSEQAAATKKWQTVNPELDLLLFKLNGTQVVESRIKWSACCPSCLSSRGKFGIGIEGGKLFLCCNKGCCSQDEVFKAVRKLGINIGRLLHPRDDAYRFTVSKHELTPKSFDPERAKLAEKFRKALSQEKRNSLANELRCNPNTLKLLGVGWNEAEQCFTFPEYNERGEVCGIMRRWEHGTQMVMNGHNRGVYLLKGWKKRSGPLLLVEGPSKAAACWDAGFAVIGRPAALTGNDIIVALLKDYTNEIIVIGDNDEAGIKGAENLARALSIARGQSVKIALPPEGIKNVRDLKRPRKVALLEMIDNTYSVEQQAGQSTVPELPLDARLAVGYLAHMVEVLNARSS